MAIQFESVRLIVDPDYLNAVAELEEAYYGQRDENGRFTPGTGWRDGVSSPWRGFDVQATPRDSKALFDRLHGLIWTRHHLAVVAENEAQGRPYARDKVDPVDETTRERQSTRDQAIIDAEDQKSRDATDTTRTH